MKKKIAVVSIVWSLLAALVWAFVYGATRNDPDWMD